MFRIIAHLNRIANDTTRYPLSIPFIAVLSRLTMIGAALAEWFANFKPHLHEILPIDVVAVHGAIVCGNQSTPSLLVVKFSGAQCSYSVVPVSDAIATVRTLSLPSMGGVMP
jgi:BLTP1 N-terminal region